jgi:hypothetical protein
MHNWVVGPIHAKPKTKHKLLKPFQFSHKINQIQKHGQTKIEEKTMYVIKSPSQESTKSNIIIVQTHFATTPKPKK